MNGQVAHFGESLTAIVGGLLFVLGSSVLGVPPELGLFLWVIGVALSGVGVLDLGLFLHNQGKAVSAKLSRFRKDEKAVAWIWVVAALSIMFCPFVYWAIGWPLDMVINQVAGIYTFTGVMALALTAVKTIASYILGFALLYVVIWSWVQAKSGPGN